MVKYIFFSSSQLKNLVKPFLKLFLFIIKNKPLNRRDKFNNRRWEIKNKMVNFQGFLGAHVMDFVNLHNSNIEEIVNFLQNYK